MEIPAGIAANVALTRQAIALETVKSAADMAQKMADMIAETAQNVPMASSRGTIVNFTV